MELKWWKLWLQIHRSNVLIVPLWNWNSVLTKALRTCRSFNCTFMELKSGKNGGPSMARNGFNCTFMELKFSWVLIQLEICSSFNCTFMELKFMIDIRSISCNNSFNCTFMELKFSLPWTKCMNKGVLIVPLWNWNSGRALARSNDT